MERPSGKPVVELVTLELSPAEAEEIFGACKDYGLTQSGDGVRELLLGLLREDFDDDGEEPEQEDDEGEETPVNRGQRLGEAVGNFLADEENRKMMLGAAKGIASLLRKGK